MTILWVPIISYSYSFVYKTIRDLNKQLIKHPWNTIAIVRMSDRWLWRPYIMDTELLQLLRHYFERNLIKTKNNKNK